MAKVLNSESRMITIFKLCGFERQKLSICLTVFAIFGFANLNEAHADLCNDHLTVGSVQAAQSKESAIQDIIQFLNLPSKPKPRPYKGKTIINWSEPAATSVFGRPKIVSYAYSQNSQPFGISIANSELVYIQTLDDKSKPNNVVGLYIDEFTTLEAYDHTANTIQIKASREKDNVITRMKVTLTRNGKGEITIHSVIRLTVDGVAAKPKNLEVTLTRTLPSQK